MKRKKPAVPEYRILEVRPDVYHVEEEKWTWFFGWFSQWTKIKWYYDYHSYYEYHSVVAEFTYEQASHWVKTQKENDMIEYLRKNPPEGFPRVVSDKPVE